MYSFTYINGMDKGLVEFVVEYPTKGLDPPSLSNALLVTFHERKWQAKENCLVMILERRLLNPTHHIFQRKFMELYQAQVIWPLMFCKYIDAIWSYLGSEVT